VLLWSHGTVWVSWFQVPARFAQTAWPSWKESLWGLLLCFPGVHRESPGSCLLGQWEDRPIEEHIGLAAAPANGCAALEDQPHQARLAEGQSNSLLAHGRTREMQCTAAGLFCADGWAILKLKSTRPLPASTEGSLRAHNATLLDRAASLFLSLVSLLPSFFFT
jgi:hypothetical protein